MIPAGKSIFDQGAARAASGPGGERRFPTWTVLVVATASGLTAVWIGFLLWAAARAVGGLLG